ncbi:MAG: Photosystem I reaction center subunit III [Cyanobacteria bacterium CRU_2_1]|nr:Photosystem I reaction center subunit III [Cyanobacteria bacterium RU_5_0]NJR59113.1 Photosystem I reaction center subunit III [Cyanobacteria bacterium CRU_2_1]
MRLLRIVLLPILLVTICFFTVSPAIAVNNTLVPCSKSPAFQQRKAKAPDTYYFEKPFQTYSSELLCGDDGLPHLTLDRPERAIDIAIPFAIFFYVAGFVGWSGRAYLQAANKASNPEELEIFISIPLAIQSFAQGLLWPLLAVKEFLSGELTVKDNEIPVSPR